MCGQSAFSVVQYTQITAKVPSRELSDAIVKVRKGKIK